MAKKKVFDPEEIHLINVGGFKSIIDVGFDVNELSEKFHAYHFCFAQKTALNIKEGAARIRLNTTIVARDEKKIDLDAKCEFELEFHFFIEDFASYFTHKKDEVPQIDENLGFSMLAISYSTARGIIYSKTQGSVLSGIILPVIDPKNLMNESYEIMSAIG